MTCPSPSRSGAATERIPGASSSSVSAQPRARTSRRTSARCCAECWNRAAIPDRLGSASTCPAASGGSAASRTLPSEVGMAGNRVPIVTARATIFGTATLAT